MNISGYIVYLWMFPVIFQILLPMIILLGWMVNKLPALLFGLRKPTEDRIYRHRTVMVG